MLFPNLRKGVGAIRRAVTLEALECRNLFAFGVTTGTTPTGQSTYVVDNGGDVKFAVIKSGNTTSTIHIGDLSSLQYKSKELLAPYSTTSRYSHYEQGLSAATAVTTASGGVAGSRWILVTADDSASTAMPVVQYYAVRENDPNLYLLSLPVNVNVGPGEGRFIAYLSRSVFSTPELPSDNAPHSPSDVVTTIEGGDVFGHSDGVVDTNGNPVYQTSSSKFFNMGRRMIDNVQHGLVGNVSGTPVGAWMYMGNREHSAGGPFFKDIDFQASGAVEIYNCIFTGHTQVEAYRQGLHTYAMQLTNGAAPTTPDYSWLESLKNPDGSFMIRGFVPDSGRGTLSGTASGMISGHQTVIGLSNANAQYWTYANPSTGTYTIPGIEPGTYTETIYDNELEVGTRTVTIAAGQTTRANIASTYYRPTATWRMGSWDGTPAGFLNADKISVQHPSDVRMSPWVLPADPTTGVPTFNVGSDTDSEWPMVQFMGVNNSNRIAFTLTSQQAAVAQTLRIGITLGFEGGRNRVTVNSGKSYAWTSSIPSASRDLNSRGITRGTWRGPNQLYTYNIPTSALRAGLNTIDLGVVSGSYAAGQTWLSPNVVYDAIDMVPTSSVNAPAVSKVVVTPTTKTIGTNSTTTFIATAYDASNNVVPANIVWTSTFGTVDNTGSYTAPGFAGSGTVVATVGSLSASAAVTIVNPPQVTSFSVNGGSPQRSRVTSLGVTFNTNVTLAGGAISLWQKNGTNWNQIFDFVLSPASNASTYTATFPNSAASTLPTGIYELRVTGSAVTSNGVAMSGNSAYSFYRLAGDNDGSRTVDFNDFLQLQNAFGATVGSASYQPGLDLDGNDVIDFNDFLVLQNNFGATI